MKRWGTWGAVFVVALAGAYLLGRNRSADRVSPSAPLGHVGFEPAAVDLGDQLWDTLIPFEMTFVNHAKGAITIQSIASSCDCVVVDGSAFEGRSVPENGTLALPLTLDAGSYPGRKHRTITLTAASGQKYTAELFVNIYGTWSLTPDTLDLGEVLLGDHDAPEAEAALTFVSDTEELVGDPQPDVSWLRCTTAKRDDRQTDILVRAIQDRLPPGVSTAHVTFRTTSTTRPDTSVYVRVKGVPALVATPATVFLEGDEVRRVRVTDRDGEPLRIARAEVSADSVRATIVEGGHEVALSRNAEAQRPRTATVRIEDTTGRTGAIIVSTL